MKHLSKYNYLLKNLNAKKTEFSGVKLQIPTTEYNTLYGTHLTGTTPKTVTKYNYLLKHLYKNRTELSSYRIQISDEEYNKLNNPSTNNDKSYTYTYTYTYTYSCAYAYNK